MTSQVYGQKYFFTGLILLLSLCGGSGCEDSSEVNQGIGTQKQVPLDPQDNPPPGPAAGSSEVSTQTETSSSRDAYTQAESTSKSVGTQFDEPETRVMNETSNPISLTKSSFIDKSTQAKLRSKTVSTQTNSVNNFNPDETRYIDDAEPSVDINNSNVKDFSYSGDVDFKEKILTYQDCEIIFGEEGEYKNTKRIFLEDSAVNSKCLELFPDDLDFLSFTNIKLIDDKDREPQEVWGGVSELISLKIGWKDVSLELVDGRKLSRALIYSDSSVGSVSLKKALFGKEDIEIAADDFQQPDLNISEQVLREENVLNKEVPKQACPYTHLYLLGLKVDEEGARLLAPNIPCLKFLRLGNTVIDTESLRTLVDNLPELETLEIIGSKLGDAEAGIIANANLLSLTTLNLESNCIGLKGARAIHEEFKNKKLAWLSLAKNSVELQAMPGELSSQIRLDTMQNDLSDSDQFKGTDQRKEKNVDKHIPFLGELNPKIAQNLTLKQTRPNSPKEQLLNKINNSGVKSKFKVKNTLQDPKLNE